MKYILIMILLSASVYSKRIRVDAKWRCDRLNYDSSVLSLPKYADLKIVYNSKNDQIKFRPDIFNQIDMNKALAVNSNSCIKRLINTIGPSLSRFLDKCKNCNVDKSKVQNSLMASILKSKYFVKARGIAQLPRVYSGHDQSTSLMEGRASFELRENFCSKVKLGASDLVKANSSQFINYLSKTITRNFDAFDKACIDKLKSTLHKFSFVPKEECKMKVCDEIRQRNESKASAIKQLDEDYKNAQIEKDDQNLKSHGFNRFSEKALAHTENAIGVESKVACNINYVSTGLGYDGTFNVLSQDDSISQLIDTKFKGMSKGCVKEFIRRYISYKEDRMDSKQGLCSSDYCNERVSLYRSNITRLLRLNHKNEEVEYFCKNYTKAEEKKRYGYFSDFWKKLDDIGMCTELKIGESRALVHSNKNSPLGHYHGLKRVSDKKYEASLAINFNSSSPQKNEEMRKRANDCIAKTSDYFKSADGEQIDLKLITPEDNDKLPEGEKLKVVDIDIAQDGGYFRSHSRRYAGDIKCSTITHELLHLMGLVDEYHENATQVYYDPKTKEAYSERYFPADKDKKKYKRKTAYKDCRTHSKTNSVMSSQDKLFAEVVKSKLTCECKGKACADIMSETSDNAISKLAVFRVADDFNFNKNCKVKYKKSVRAVAGQVFDGQYYSNVKSTGATLSFMTKSLSFPASWNEIKRPTITNEQYTCICKDEKCRREITEYKKKYLDTNRFNASNFCPSGANTLKDRSDAMVDSSASGYVSNKDRTFSFVTTPIKKSLLHAAHFEKVKWGSCSTRSKKYNKCAGYAYKLVDFQCEDKPDYCKEDKGWLLTN